MVRHRGNPKSRGDAMNSPVLRWLKVLLFGCALGLLLVFVNLALWYLLPHSLGTSRGADHSFRLSADPVKRDLLLVVNSQLTAFRRDDYATAYTFADSAIHSQVNQAQFEHMVRAGYPAIIGSHSASFGVSMDNGSEAFVNIGVISASGRVIHYRYFLHREPGGWKISGVLRIPAEGTTA